MNTKAQENQRQQLFSMIKMVMLGPGSDWKVTLESRASINLSNGVWRKRIAELNLLRIEKDAGRLMISLARNGRKRPFSSYSSKNIYIGASNDEVVYYGLEHLGAGFGTLPNSELWLVQGTTRYLVHAEDGELFVTIQN